MRVEIENVRMGKQYETDKSEATFDVRMDASLYIDLRVMKNKYGHYFLAFPTRKRKDAFGDEKYVRVYDWGKDRNEQFEKAVIEKMKDLLH